MNWKGDKSGKKIAMILLTIFCSFCWLGAMIFVLEKLKNLRVILGQINPEGIIFHPPLISNLISLKTNAMGLGDFVQGTILGVYLLLGWVLIVCLFVVYLELLVS